MATSAISANCEVPIGGGAQDGSFAAGPAHPGGCRCCAAPGRFCAEAV